MIIEASHTHLYPGNRGRVTGLAAIDEIGRAHDCVVEFSDGSAAAGSVSRVQDGWQLQVGAYRTRAGTDIADKRWTIGLEAIGERIEFRILARAG